ncbi:ribosomal 50S subunit-recycling heat shock protein [Bacillus mesophilus]|uniref:RQC P-site tRNA stabilizing factor n=1 Tax=Bacillus mesophilus TaxID=1808955 RepID=A0A6M0QEI2_9BACI|nr:RNA-binding S4 domain-containing protein [Bacillus mesophilus]MBM7663430.1 ribosomal 50S subunit-recycling heat shock protein [Bacillus mesophilus]NEY74120.1 RNA-binding S4 domain-containing protein [Bacillus mesophilus]
MRLDKFLKVSRLIKRRTLAKEVADQGRITINGIEAKASSNVKVGDMLTVRFGQKLVTVQIDSIQETTKKENATQLYTVVKEEKITTDNILN